MTKIEAFFARYEQAANSFDADIVTSEFSDCFMGADPNGVACIQNDDMFRKAIPQRHAFFQQIGFRSAKILGLVETPLDERYTMVKVHWHMIFEKQPRQPLHFKFFVTYVLFDTGTGPKVVFYISHDDEQKVMKDAGLIGSETKQT
jgi:hypothetical protein